MEPDTIQKRALATWYGDGDKLQFQLLPSILGLAGETGEIVDLYKKGRFEPGFTATWREMLDELGDVLYYVAIIAWQLGVTLDELSQMNRAKLAGGRHGWRETGGRLQEPRKETR